MAQKISVTVDSVVFCKANNQFKVLLIQRKNEPFKDEWALPGGFVNEGENLETAAKRELLEETGVEVKSMQQVQAFGEPGRDPRGHTISIAFLSRIFCEEHLKPSDDAKDAQWFAIEKLHSMKLAFDHDEIINVAQQFL
ncbi:NUDIX domain-containing protein [Christiangramia forsetii]|uniref:NUDIX family hydrolase n=2 Tax=Christiangramia forsetii TaxID=411153 RepID=A0M1J3_CHRFK|nr:NUDIX hydrolase [Christiangramia forsetii]GGG42392.1 NUDIX hydrolase [Christiangramia forsetii]CAL66488.1 NUDIX family hydrolase [Christiangramia forsetii KT0803]